MNFYEVADNVCKLGYGGTKEEMARLLENAEKISGIKYDISSYADIVDAIHVIQDNMGIAGATAEEAATTISGSLGMVKASWQNVITALSDSEGGDLLSQYLEDLTESVGIFANNILPVISTAVSNVGTMVSELLPQIVEMLPSLVQEALPPLIEALKSTISAVATALPELISVVSTVLGEQGIPLVMSLVTGLLDALPSILESAKTLIIALAQGIGEALPELLPAVVLTIQELVNMLLAPDSINMILSAALQLVLGLALGLAEAIPNLVSAVTDVVEGITKFATNPENIALILSVALQLILALGGGLISSIPELLKSVGVVILGIVDNFRNADWAGMGTNLVDGFKKGIENAWANLKKWFTSLFDDLIGIAKKILGIQSPSKIFAEMGMFVDEGLAKGINDYAHVAVGAAKDLAKDVESASQIDTSILVTPKPSDIKPAKATGAIEGVDFNELATSSIDGIASIAKSVDYNALVSASIQGVSALVDLFKSGEAKVGVGNTRDLRRALNA